MKKQLYCYHSKNYYYYHHYYYGSIFQLDEGDRRGNNQGCSPRDRGLGLESTQDRLYAVLVLRAKVNVCVNYVHFVFNCHMQSWSWSRTRRSWHWCGLGSANTGLGLGLATAGLDYDTDNSQIILKRKFKLDVRKSAFT